MEEILLLSQKLIQRVGLDFKRFVYPKLHSDKPLIGVKGARGTGKTTLVLQWLKELSVPDSAKAYFSLDHLYFASHSLWDTAVAFFQQGGKYLALDEVHKYEGWSAELKNLYDHYPELQIRFTGSSIIDLSQQEADLSRRVFWYELPGLSYREYLSFKGIYHQEAFSLSRLLENPPGREVFPEDFRPLAHWAEYLRRGYYPFAHGSDLEYFQQLQQLVRIIVEYDMAELRSFDIRNAKKILQLLYRLSQLAPYKPNLSELAEKTRIHRNSLNAYLVYLGEARLLRLLYPAGVSLATLEKPEKIFLDNPNLIFALSEGKPNWGPVRETFFLTQLSLFHRVHHPRKGDYCVNEKYTFEIGGPQKGSRQIADVENSWVVRDQLEYPVADKLPLWLFGFLY